MSRTYKWRRFGTNSKLDKEVTSKDSDVRWQMAYQGYGLEVLVNDKNASVRRAVAIRGFGLDKLSLDKELWVRERVDMYLKDNNLTLEEWKSKYPEKCALIAK